MKILHILDHSLPLQSGYTFRTIGILNAQRQRGWDTVQLTTPKQYKSEGAVDQVDGWTFYRTPVNSGISQKLPILREYREMRATARRLGQVIEETQPDILHAHSPILNGLPALKLARQCNLPLLYEVRSFWEDAAVEAGAAMAWGPRYRATRGLESVILRRADAVVAICEGLRNDILARGIEAEKVTVVPNAVDSELFTMARNPDAELRRELGLEGSAVLGFIGSFYGYEGLDLLLQATTLLLRRQPSVKLLLVGGGPVKDRLVALTRELNLQDQVVFTGRVPHSEVGRYYDLVDIFVYPRLSMRLTDLVTPMKPLEAMAKGSVVVASDVGGHQELIADGQRGFLFEADNREALASRLAEVIENREDWPRLAAAGRRYVEEERNWKAVTARYEPIYQRLMAVRGRKAESAAA